MLPKPGSQSTHSKKRHGTIAADTLIRAAPVTLDRPRQINTATSTYRAGELMTYPPPPGPAGQQPQQPYPYAAGQQPHGYPPGQFQQAGYPYGPPPGSGPHPQFRPGPPPRKKTPVWPWLVVAVFIVIAFPSCLVAENNDANEPKPATSPTRVAPAAGAEPTSPRSTVAPAGSPVRDGQFEFRVTAVDPPTPSVGTGSREVRAKGDFLVIHVDITNTGNQPRSYFDDNQKLIDDQGREFANDSTAARRLDTETSEYDLNPGFTISVKIVFDVPPGTAPAAIEFHDSMWSDGVKVALR